jgi:hypothetical protein
MPLNVMGKPIQGHNKPNGKLLLLMIQKHL